MKYRIKWARDKMAMKLLNAEIQQKIWHERFSIFGIIALAEELLPKFPETLGLAFLNVQVADGDGRPGDQAGDYQLWIEPQQGEAWIEWSLGLTKIDKKTLKHHKVDINDGILSHTIATIERYRNRKWE